MIPLVEAIEQGKAQNVNLGQLRIVVSRRVPVQSAGKFLLNERP